MLEILKTLRDTPLPIILVIGGLIFLLVPFIRRVSDKVEIETTNKGLAGFIGFILLVIGIGLYLIPPSLQTQTPATSTSTPITIPYPTLSSPVPESTFSPPNGIPTITAASIITVKAEDVIPYVQGEVDGIRNVIEWWQEVDPSGTGGVITPSTMANRQCFGLAWNTSEYGYRKLIVFQRQISINFLDGGWHTTVCVPNNVIISAEDVGKIQADWLGKRYVDVNAQPWAVLVK